MRTIHKHVLSGVENRVVTHVGARFIHADDQRDQITVWAEVDTDQPLTQRTLHVVGTGNPIPDGDLDHVGSLLAGGGAFVFHVYADREFAPTETPRCVHADAPRDGSTCSACGGVR